MASLLWFVAGKQSLSSKRNDFAFLWQCVAVLTVLVLCGWEVVKQEWIGLVCSVVVLCVEVRSIRRMLTIGDDRD